MFENYTIALYTLVVIPQYLKSYNQQNSTNFPHKRKKCHANGKEK